MNWVQLRPLAGANDVIPLDSSEGPCSKPIAGVALKGAVITPDDSRNRAIYGMRARDMLLSTPAGVPSLVKPAGLEVFPQTLARYSSGKK